MGFFGIWMLAILASCRTLFPLPVEEKTIATVQSWAYQLQNIELSELERSSYDLLVIDYSYSIDGSEIRAWSSAEIKRVKESGSRKLVLAYLSIGEAETHRSYWESSWGPGNPTWLGRGVNNSDDRPPRFHVKYWDPEWKRILKNLLDRVISQGFDGVLLDGCDAYTYWSDDQNREGEILSKEEAANQMIQLIAELSIYARNRVAEFIVCTQERTRLLSATSDIPNQESYLRAIQGVVGAGIFFPGETPEDNPYAPASELVEYFQDLRSRGKMVFSLEYLSQTNTTDVEQYVQQAKTYKFLPYATNRALDRLRFR